MKTKVLVLATLLLLATSLVAQKKPEKPKLHSDFHFGTYPVSRDAGTLMAKENARLLLVGFHQGWDIEKIAKESKVAVDDLDKIFADLDDAKLATEVEGTMRPLMTVIRDKDIEKVQKNLQIDTQDFANLFRSNWAQIETAAASFAGAKGVTKPELLYQIVVGGIVFGGMHDSFFEDQTLMVNPPRRTGSQRYYAWLVESNPTLAGLLKREQWESGGYTMVSIGSGLSKDRATLEQLRAANGMLLDEAEARRFRSFIAIFSREKLLPFFKKNRSDFLKSLDLLDAGRYASVSEAFSWYYDQMANGAAEQLVSGRFIEPPKGGQYVYALRAPAR